MLQRIKAYIKKHHMIESKDQIIVGVSGGADSVCLLKILADLREELDFGLKVIHVEHGIRGEESVADAKFTMQLCETMGISCVMIPVDVPSYAKSKGGGFEEAARILRYNVFVEQAKACGGKVALAHHMEDNAETLLFQMVRGSGLKGMCGIDPVREDGDGVRYIRPLLCVRRMEIEGYLKRQGQSYCLDSTNLDLVYSRNRMRNQVIPQLQEINTQAVEHLNRSAQQLHLVWNYMYEQMEQLLDRLVKCSSPYMVDAVGLCEVHPALQTMLVHELIARVAGVKKDICSQHVNDFIALAQGRSGKQLCLPYGIRVRKEFGNLVFEKATGDEGQRSEVYPPQFVEKSTIDVSQCELHNLAYGEKLEVFLGHRGDALTISKMHFDGKMEEIPKNKCTKWLDYDKIKDGFQLRKRKPGDYFVNDSKGHRKKLKQYFIDEKIPVSEREYLWLMAKGSEIMWIIGERMSEAFKISADTTTVLEIAYREGSEYGFYERI